MDIKIYLGDGICTRCGKKHKKIFEIDGKVYGLSCARDILGKNLSAPVWLYKLAEEILNNMKEDNVKVFDDSQENFEAEFWFKLSKKTSTILDNYEGSKLFSKPIKINGKNVKVDWQYEINEYILNRQKDYLNG